MAKWLCQTCGKKLKNKTAAAGHRRYLPDHTLVSDDGEPLGDAPVAIIEAVQKVMGQVEDDPDLDPASKSNPLPPRPLTSSASLRLDERTGRMTMSISIDMTTLWRWRWMRQNGIFPGSLGELFDWALDDALRARGVAAPDAVLDPDLAKNVEEDDDELSRTEAPSPNGSGHPTPA